MTHTHSAREGGAGQGDVCSGSRQREGLDQGRVGRGWVCGVEGGAERGEGVDGVEGGRAASRARGEWVLGADAGAI